MRIGEYVDRWQEHSERYEIEGRIVEQAMRDAGSGANSTHAIGIEALFSHLGDYVSRAINGQYTAERFLTELLGGFLANYPLLGEVLALQYLDGMLREDDTRRTETTRAELASIIARQRAEIAASASLVDSYRHEFLSDLGVEL